jgi:uncharacterized protein YecT (DUF1311 family)
MRHILLTILLSHFIIGITYSQTTSEMKEQAAQSYKTADAELNGVYQQILKEYSDDTVFLEALRTSQRNWIKFRDSELKMKYPERGPGWYGSIHPICISYYLADLTNERTEGLKIWLTGTEEGDVCSGTIKIK